MGYAGTNKKASFFIYSAVALVAIHRPGWESDVPSVRAEM